MTSLQNAIDANWVFPGTTDSTFEITCNSLGLSGEYYLTPFTAEVFAIDSVFWNPAADSGCVPTGELCLEISYSGDVAMPTDQLIFTFPDGSTLNGYDLILNAIGIPFDTIDAALIDQLPVFAPNGLCFPLDALYNGDPNGTWSISAFNAGTGSLTIELADLELLVDADSCSLISTDQLTTVLGQTINIGGNTSSSVDIIIPPLPANFPTVNAACNVFGDATLIDFLCPVGINDVTSFTNVNVYPNPNNGAFTVSFEMLERSDVEISVYNLWGQNVATQQFQNIHGNFNETLNFSNNLSEGMYFVSIKANNQQYQYKIVVR